MNETAKAGSFEPDDFTQGGFFDDKDATIVDAKIVMFDYQGKADPVCALMVAFKADDSESGDEPRAEYYRIGSPDKFTPSSDGKFYVPVGTTTSMNKKTKAALFLRSLKEQGFEMAKLGQGIDGMVDTRVHVNIVPMPEIEGSEKKDNKILVVTKILAAAPAAAGAKPKAAAKSGSTKGAAAPTTAVASPAAASSVDGAEDKAQEIIIGLIAEKGGKIAKGLIPPAMFSGIPANEAKLRNACIALAGNVGWLSAGDRPWQYNGGELSFGG